MLIIIHTPQGAPTGGWSFHLNWSQVFIELSEDLGAHICQPYTMCHTILESLRQTQNYSVKLIDLRGKLRLPAASKGSER